MDDKLKRIRTLIDLKEATDAELAGLIGDAPQPVVADAQKAKRGRPPKPAATAETVTVQGNGHAEPAHDPPTEMTDAS